MPFRSAALTRRIESCLNPTPCHSEAERSGDEEIEEAAVWLEDHRRFWTQRLDALADYVTTLEEGGDD